MGNRISKVFRELVKGERIYIFNVLSIAAAKVFQQRSKLLPIHSIKVMCQADSALRAPDMNFQGVLRDYQVLILSCIILVSVIVLKKTDRLCKI